MNPRFLASLTYVSESKERGKIVRSRTVTAKRVYSMVLAVADFFPPVSRLPAEHSRYEQRLKHLPARLNIACRKIQPKNRDARTILNDGGYGFRSKFEDEVRWRHPTASLDSSWSMTSMREGHSIITPSCLHFERHLRCSPFPGHDLAFFKL